MAGTLRVVRYIQTSHWVSSKELKSVDFERALFVVISAFYNEIQCGLQFFCSNCLEPVEEVEGEEKEGGGEDEPVGEDAENAGSQASARECPGRYPSIRGSEDGLSFI